MNPIEIKLGVLCFLVVGIAICSTWMSKPLYENENED
jgi:hypothetical protein